MGKETAQGSVGRAHKPTAYSWETFHFWREIAEVIAERPVRHCMQPGLQGMSHTHQQSYVRLLAAVLNACQADRHTYVLSILIVEARRECAGDEDSALAGGLVSEAERLLAKPEKLGVFSDRDYVIQGMVTCSRHDPETSHAAELLNAARWYATEFSENERDMSLADRPLLEATWAFGFNEKNCERIAALVEPQKKARRAA